MASTPLFLDTSGWISLLDQREPYHDLARQIWSEAARFRIEIVLTDWIVAETGNGMAKGPARQSFVATYHRCRASPQVSVMAMTPSKIKQAVKLYQSRPDKMWGLVDCASFVLMTELGIRDALTNDQHFEQAGFRRLLA